MAPPQEQKFTFSGVVSSIPLMYGAKFDKTRDQMNNWRWDNTRDIGDQVDRSNLQTIISGKVNRTGKRVPKYSCDDLRAKIEPPRCQQYKSGDFLACRPQNRDEIIDEGDDG
jgi:hypothetical protein